MATIYISGPITGIPDGNRCLAHADQIEGA